VRSRGALLVSVLLGLFGLAVALPMTIAHADTIPGATAGQLTPSSLFVQGPYQSTAGVGATDNIMGSLTIGGSAAPEGTPIDITRTESGNGDVAQFTAATDALGNFMSFDTLPALGMYTYVISYPGNATTAPASYSDYEVTVEPMQTSISFITEPNTYIAGQPLTVTGQLQPDGGGLDTPPAGTVINITRTLAGSTSTATFAPTTDVNGLFTITDTPPVAGTYTYTASYTSDNPDISSSTGTYVVTLSSSTSPSPSYSGTIRLTKMGLCLDDRSNSSRNGAIVQVWQCTGDAAQQWQVFSDGTIRHNGLCLDATGYGTANGTKVQLWACTGAANQKWDTKEWRIHYDNPAAVNKVLDDTGSGGNGTQQQIWTNTGGANQYWTTS
jgi:hypothetical protein